MDIWQWVLDYRRRAEEAGDAARVKLTRFSAKAYAVRETDPERALALYEEGTRLAKALNEPWWVLFYDDWRLTAMMAFLRDYRHALELAVASVLEVRKPQYDGLPLRVSLQDHLVDAYMGVDPHGHAEQVREALAHLERAAEAGGEPPYRVLGTRREFALSLGKLDEAEGLARQTLAVADADPDRSNLPHWGAFATDALCEIAWRRQDWAALGEWARAGEEYAREVGHQVELANMRLWQALAALLAGDRPQAQRLRQLSVNGMRRVRMPPEPKYFDALADLREREGDLDRALAVRDWQLETLVDHGRHHAETSCRVQRCRLLVRLGRPLADELAAARVTAARLRLPAGPLAELEAIEKGQG